MIFNEHVAAVEIGREPSRGIVASREFVVRDRVKRFSKAFHGRRRNDRESPEAIGVQAARGARSAGGLAFGAAIA